MRDSVTVGAREVLPIDVALVLYEFPEVWDMAKVALTLFVIGPFANPERVGPSRLMAGLLFALVLGAGAYMIDGRELHR